MGTWNRQATMAVRIMAEPGPITSSAVPITCVWRQHPGRTGIIAGSVMQRLRRNPIHSRMVRSRLRSNTGMASKMGRALMAACAGSIMPKTSWSWRIHWNPPLVIRTATGPMPRDYSLITALPSLALSPIMKTFTMACGNTPGNRDSIQSVRR